MRGQSQESLVVSSAIRRRINRTASVRGTRHRLSRGAGGGRPMGADGAARRANGGGPITQATRAGAWRSRAHRVTTARSRRDVTGAPPRDVAGARARKVAVVVRTRTVIVTPRSVTPSHVSATILTGANDRKK